MKVRLLSFLLAANAGVLSAQPVDLLQQLYGKKIDVSERPALAAPEVEPEVVPGSSLVLRLQDRFDASRERLFLSDLLRCEGPQAICEELLAIDVGVAPKPLRHELMRREQLERLIEREYPDLILRWEGAEQVVVAALSSPVDQEAVMKVLAEEFEDAPAGTRVVIQGIRVPTLNILRHRNYSYRVQDFGDQVTRVFQNPRTRLAQIRVAAVDQDPVSQSSIEFLVQVSLRIEIEALVLNGGKERGERLTAEDLELKWIPYQDQVIHDTKQIEGKLLKTRVQAGNPLRSWNVTREPEVLRGDRVEAIISSNGVRMNSVAQALEQGFIGQKIRIKLDATKKTIMGRVIAKSQVEVPSL